jgi:hypothetical protein
MTRLNWEATRYYEFGVDQTVLYTTGNPGVSWSGIVSIVESQSGGTARPFYMDGTKYINLSSLSEYEATINAMGYPPEFERCDGSNRIQNGLILTNQPKTSFGLCYRTKIGTALNQNHAYKYHLVYNALANPSQVTNRTISTSSNPVSFSWKITATPPAATGYKPTAHFVIDTRYASSGVLSSFEDIIYGSNSTDSRLPTQSELVSLFTP